MVKCNVSLLCKSTSQLKRRRIDETPEQYLGHVTHLYLSGKHLEEIGSEIRLCKNLNVLYLYDNLLKSIPDLFGVVHLTHLYLQNNRIERIENLTNLTKLEKLYLSRNCISVIERLEGLISLRELRIDNQRLPPGDRLLFDEECLLSIAKSLVKLDVSGNGLRSLDELRALRNLTALSATNNQLSSITELSETLQHWPCLKQLDLQGNQVVTKPRAKDIIIVSSRSLEILDDKPIAPNTRRFLENWNQHLGIRVDAAETTMKAVQSPVVAELESADTELAETEIPSYGAAPMGRTTLGGLESPQGEMVQSGIELFEKDKRLSSGGTTDEMKSIDWPHITPPIGPAGCGEARPQPKVDEDALANDMATVIIH